MMILVFFVSSIILIINILCMGLLLHYILNKITHDDNVFYYSSIPVLGIVAYSMYVFLTGYFISLNIFFLCLPLLLIFFFLRDFQQLRVIGKQYLFRFYCAKKFVFYSICLSVILLFTFLRIFGTRILGDSLVYHLYLPKQYVNAGYILRVPFSEHALWPQLVEMFLTFGLYFNSIPTAKFFSFFVYLLLGILTFLLTKSLTKSTVLSFLSAVFVFAPPAFFFFSAATYVDLTVTLCTVSMVYFIHRYYIEEKRIHLCIAAVSCAGALSCKYTSIIVFASVLIVMVLKGSGRRRFCDIGLFLAVCLVFCCPWYLRSYLESGNPLFPFGYNLFGSGFPSPVPTEKMTFLGRLIHAGTGHDNGAGTGVLNFIMLPFDLTFRQDLFGGERTGFLYIIMLPFFVYTFFRKEKHWIIQLFVMLFIVQWFMLDQMLRFLFPVFPLYMCISFLGIRMLWKKKRIKQAFFALIAPILVFQTLWSGYYFYQDFEHVFKGKSRESYLDYSYRVGKFLKAKNIDNERILLVGDNNVFYLPDNTIRENTFRNFTRYDMQSDKLAFLKKNDIKYVLVNTYSKGLFSSKYDPISYFQSEEGRGVSMMGKYQDEYDFILYKLN